MIETRTVTMVQVHIYVFVLNTFGPAEEGRFVAVSTDYNKLVEWYQEQFEPSGPYREDGWYKTFRKGSPIEYNNPCRSLELNDTRPFGHGIHDEWIPLEAYENLKCTYNNFVVLE